MEIRDLRKTDSEIVWSLWIEKRDQNAKNELIVRYIPLVEQVSGRLKIGLPNSVNINDLINSGVIGLIAAIENYDHNRANRFETYAVARIRGSILDGLRDYDWMPRSIRSKTRMLENALVKLEGNLGRVPTDEEVSAELKLGLDDYYQLLDEVKVASILSLDEPISTSDGESGTISDMVEDEDAIDPSQHVEWDEAKTMAKKLIKNLK